MQKRFLTVVQQCPRAGIASNERYQCDRDDEACVPAQVFAVSGNGSELAWPERDGSGGIGLNGQKAGLEQRGKGDESASSGNGVHKAAKKCGETQKQILRSRWRNKKGSVHRYIVDAARCSSYARISGVAARRDRVYASRGVLQITRVGPLSTSLPRQSTAMSVAR